MMNKRKLISSVLTVSMMLTLFPYQAFAEEGPQAAPVENVQQTEKAGLPEADNGVVTLTEDVTVKSLQSNMTYDLNGHNLTLDLSGNTPSILVRDKEVLTIKDSSVSAPQKGGSLILTGSENAFFNPQKGGTLNAENIYVTCTGTAFFP